MIPYAKLYADIKYFSIIFYNKLSMVTENDSLQ